MTTPKTAHTIALPFSEEGERTILSCILMDGQIALAKAIDSKLTEDSFYDPTYRRVWKAIQWQHKNNKPLELYALAEELKKNGKLDEMGGYTALVDATSAVSTTAQYGYWLEKVRQLHIMREVYGSCTRMTDKIMARSGSVEDFITEMNCILSANHNSRKQKSVEEAADETLELLGRIERGEFREKDMGLQFPWPDWDKRFGVAKSGELIIISARPGMGKSSCMRQIVDKWAKLGKVLVFSREMTVEQMTPLIAQTNSNICWKELLKGNGTMEDVSKFRAELTLIKNRKSIEVYDRDRTLSHIVTRAKAFAQVHKPIAIFIDYLQRYDAQQERGETRDVALGRFTMAMKDLAIELGIPVILLAQLGRSVEKENREPRMSDLRESGNLEQDADRIIFLNAPDHRPDGTPQFLTDNDVRFIYIDAIQAKGRSDGTGRSGMMFDRPLTKFSQHVA